MHSTTRLQLRELNPHLLCVLCGGYLIDATTIIECIHSFCRTCIIKYLESSKYCPICDVQVHKTKPLLNVRSDKTLQTLVYKLVPSLFKEEMRRRREFYAAHPDQAIQSTLSLNASELRGEVEIGHDINTKRDDEQISLCLQSCAKLPPYHNEHLCSARSTDNGQILDRRYLLCPSSVTIGHLKKLIRLKFDLPPTYRVDIFYSDEGLRDSYTLLDVAHIYAWRRVEPLKLYYIMHDRSLSQLHLSPPSVKSVCRQSKDTRLQNKRGLSLYTLRMTISDTETNSTDCQGKPAATGTEPGALTASTDDRQPADVSVRDGDGDKGNNDNNGDKESSSLNDGVNNGSGSGQDESSDSGRDSRQLGGASEQQVTTDVAKDAEHSPEVDCTERRAGSQTPAGVMAVDEEKDGGTAGGSGSGSEKSVDVVDGERAEERVTSSSEAVPDDQQETRPPPGGVDNSTSSATNNGGVSVSVSDGSSTARPAARSYPASTYTSSGPATATATAAMATAATAATATAATAATATAAAATNGRLSQGELKKIGLLPRCFAPNGDGQRRLLPPNGLSNQQHLRHHQQHHQHHQQQHHRSATTSLTPRYVTMANGQQYPILFVGTTDAIGPMAFSTGGVPVLANTLTNQQQQRYFIPNNGNNNNNNNNNGQVVSSRQPPVSRHVSDGSGSAAKWSGGADRNGHQQRAPCWRKSASPAEVGDRSKSAAAAVAEGGALKLANGREPLSKLNRKRNRRDDGAADCKPAKMAAHANDVITAADSDRAEGLNMTPTNGSLEKHVTPNA